MNKLLLTALAILVGAITATAELGETIAQFEKGPPTMTFAQGDRPIRVLAWDGKHFAHIGMFEIQNGTYRCVEEQFVFHADSKMTGNDVKRFLQPYHDHGIDKSLTVMTETKVSSSLVDVTGEYYGVVMLDIQAQTLTIYDYRVWESTYKKDFQKELDVYYHTHPQDDPRPPKTADEILHDL